MKKHTFKIAGATLGFAVLFNATPSLATEQMAYTLFGDPAYITKCNLCHTNANINTADKGNLMSAAKSAYNQDKWGLSGLKTFVAAAATPIAVPKTCVSPQMLDTATNSCFTPVPTCTGGQVLNPTKTACITSAPVVPTCKSTEVLNATKTACIAKPTVATPTCKSTEVLNATKTACVVKPVTPTCATGEFLNITKTACVAPPATRVNTNPILNSVTQQWDAKVGEAFKISLSVKDAEQDEFVITGKTTGATFSAVYTDEKSLLPTIDFLWTPTTAQVNKIFTIPFQAKETKTSQKLTSNKVSVKIRVWAAGTNTSASITKLNVSTSTWKLGKLNLAGNVVFSNLLTAEERKNFIATPFDLTVTSGKDPKGGALVGFAPLKLDAKGNWSVNLPVTQVPCDITLQYEGQVASRTVIGCVKPVSIAPVSVASNAVINNPFSRDNDDDDDKNDDGKDDDD